MGIQSKLFSDFTNNPFLPHMPLSAEGNRCPAPGAVVQRNLPTFGQAVIHQVAKGMSTLPSTTSRGLLVWHSTGSGKSCTAIAIANAFKGTRRPVYYITTAALRTKTDTELRACTNDLFMAKDPAVYNVMTYAILAHMIKKRRIEMNAVLILDEVHNLYFPLPHQQAEHKTLLDCLLYDNPSISDAKIFVMTATPGNNTSQLLQLLNIIRPRPAPEITMPDIKDPASIDRFTRSLVGLVSYLNTDNDMSLFPTVTVNEPRFALLSDEHYIHYMDKLAGSPEEQADYARLSRERKVDRYYVAARRASNAMPAACGGGDDKPVLMEEFSAKLPQLIATINEHADDKHYVYSAFFHQYCGCDEGVNMIAKSLKAQGYEELDVGMLANNATLMKKPRFMLLTSSKLSGGKTKSDAREKHNIDKLMGLFNSPKNARAEYCGVILAPQGFNEGIDLKAIRHVHLFEPLIEYNMEKQAVGRAVRHCSHAQLRKEYGEWTVQVHRYISDHPADAVVRLIDYSPDMSPEDRAAVDGANTYQENMIEKIIYKEARERINEMHTLQLCMRRAAVDCMLTENFHGDIDNCVEEGDDVKPPPPAAAITVG